MAPGEEIARPRRVVPTVPTVAPTPVPAPQAPVPQAPRYVPHCVCVTAVYGIVLHLLCSVCLHVCIPEVPGQDTLFSLLLFTSIKRQKFIFYESLFTFSIFYILTQMSPASNATAFVV